MADTRAQEAKRSVVTGDAQTLDKVVEFFCTRFSLPVFEVKSVVEIAEYFESQIALVPRPDAIIDSARLNAAIAEIVPFTDAPASDEILAACLDLAKMLLQKNSAYGNSALEPLRVFSKADAAEQIKVRMDDKLSRLMRGQAAGEDALTDFVGYYILLMVLKRRAEALRLAGGNGHGA